MVRIICIDDWYYPEYYRTYYIKWFSTWKRYRECAAIPIDLHPLDATFRDEVDVCFKNYKDAEEYLDTKKEDHNQSSLKSI